MLVISSVPKNHFALFFFMAHFILTERLLQLIRSYSVSNNLQQTRDTTKLSYLVNEM